MCVMRLGRANVSRSADACTLTGLFPFNNIVWMALIAIATYKPRKLTSLIAIIGLVPAIIMKDSLAIESIQLNVQLLQQCPGK